jgi:hypothetical protein
MCYETYRRLRRLANPSPQTDGRCDCRRPPLLQKLDWIFAVFRGDFLCRWIRSGRGNTGQDFPTVNAMTDQGQTTLFVMDQCNNGISKVIE